ncbi:hypothetical protein MMC13_000773 [Lambiella insularis]|nr:hypothetical protein [Lambiella insularis]
MRPVEYFRALSDISLQKLQHGRRDNKCRASMKDWLYWREEVKFYIQFVPSYEKRRQKIDNGGYWKRECGHWRELHNKKIPGSRFDIPDYEYWKCELDFLLQQDETRSKDRREIPNADYWRAEMLHYEDAGFRPAENLHLEQENPGMADKSDPPICPAMLMPLSSEFSFQDRPNIKRKRQDNLETGDTVTPGTHSDIRRKVRRKIAVDNGVSTCWNCVEYPTLTREVGEEDLTVNSLATRPLDLAIFNTWVEFSASAPCHFKFLGSDFEFEKETAEAASLVLYNMVQLLEQLVEHGVSFRGANLRTALVFFAAYHSSPFHQSQLVYFARACHDRTRRDLDCDPATKVLD